MRIPISCARFQESLPTQVYQIAEQDHFRRLEECKRKKPDAILFNFHGVDGEGWWPIRQDDLRKFLDLLQSCNELEYWDLR